MVVSNAVIFLRRNRNIANSTRRVGDTKPAPSAQYAHWRRVLCIVAELYPRPADLKQSSIFALSRRMMVVSSALIFLGRNQNINDTI